MVQRKSYIEPCITIVSINSTNMLCSSSDDSTMKYVCTEWCRIWHMCRDRKAGKFCINKRYYRL